MHMLFSDRNRTILYTSCFTISNALTVDSSSSLCEIAKSNGRREKEKNTQKPKEKERKKMFRGAIPVCRRENCWGVEEGMEEGGGK
jgi:hypothetical protein